MSKIIRKGNGVHNNFHFKVTSNKVLDILDFYLLSKQMDCFCKVGWISEIEISEDHDISDIDLFFDSINDFCSVKLRCNVKYIFKEITT